ncbi:MAG: aromatic amino acid transport family protein [Gammaproteobacteria bacterium]|jgi:amino acid permease
MLNKTVGSVFILVGGTIGGGIFVLPLVSANVGFVHSAILLLATLLLTTFSSLLILKVCLNFKPYRNNFGTMTKATLGRMGQIIVCACYLIAIYTAISAFLCGSTSLADVTLKNYMHITIPAYLDTTAITLIFGLIIFLGISKIDWCMRFLTTSKGILLVAILCVLLPYANVNKIFAAEFRFTHIGFLIPVFINAFGYHALIPSICNYCDNNSRKVRKIIFISAAVILIIYTIWLLAVFSIIPQNGKISFSTIALRHSSIGGLTSALIGLTHNRYVLYAVNFFSDIAIGTSLLGLSLCLFDFIADGLNRANNRKGRLQTALLTFIPPFLFALYYKHGFTLMFQFSSIFAMVLIIFLPILMMYRLKYTKCRD